MKRRSSGMLIGLIVVGAVLVVAYAVLVVAKPQRITTVDARRSCEDFLSSTKSEIQAVTGYRIVESGKHCEKVEDELGASDYKIGAYYRLARADGAVFVKQHLDEAAAKLPAGGDHPWQLNNEPATETQPEILCVTTSKYLNDDGTYIDQGLQDKLVKYHEAGSQEPYASLCVPAELPS